MDPKNYQIITVVLVLVVIIGFSILTFLDYRSIKNLNKNTKFPPWPSKCPDYWNVLENGRCENFYKIGKCQTGKGDYSIMDFNSEPYSGSKGMYYKCRWSKQCGAPWEGVDSLC